jgi:hypothetical protein
VGRIQTQLLLTGTMSNATRSSLDANGELHLNQRLHSGIRTPGRHYQTVVGTKAWRFWKGYRPAPAGILRKTQRFVSELGVSVLIVLTYTRSTIGKMLDSNQSQLLTYSKSSSRFSRTQEFPSGTGSRNYCSLNQVLRRARIANFSSSYGRPVRQVATFLPKMRDFPQVATFLTTHNSVRTSPSPENQS